MIPRVDRQVVGIESESQPRPPALLLARGAAGRGRHEKPLQCVGTDFWGLSTARGGVSGPSGK